MIKNNNKSGISTIIATVLIVLITVAAVTILWSAVSPLIDQGADLGCFKLSDALKVDSNIGFTNYNNTAGEISIRLERGANTGDLQGFSIFVDNNGGSEGVVLNDTYGSAGGYPTENGAKVYTWTYVQLANTSDLGDVKISVAPKILLDGEITECSASTPVTLTSV